MTDKPDGKLSGWRGPVLAVFTVLAVYVLSVGPMSILNLQGYLRSGLSGDLCSASTQPPRAWAAEYRHGLVFASMGAPSQQHNSNPRVTT
jgi:hypothetical protein